MYLPNHENLTQNQVKHICNKVKLKALPYNFN